MSGNLKAVDRSAMLMNFVCMPPYLFWLLAAHPALKREIFFEMRQDSKNRKSALAFALAGFFVGLRNAARILIR
jgi:hypothetical protein